MAAAAAAKLHQSCPTLCNPRDGSPPGSPVPGILQARTLEWDAISFSNAWKWKVKVKSLSRVRLLATPWTAAHQALRPWDFPGASTMAGIFNLPECLQVSTTRKYNVTDLLSIAVYKDLCGNLGISMRCIHRVGTTEPWVIHILRLTKCHHIAFRMATKHSKRLSVTPSLSLYP